MEQQPTVHRTDKGRLLFVSVRDPDGNPTFFWRKQTFSDVHFGTASSRAERLYRVLSRTRAEITYLCGDMLDLEALTLKKKFSFGGLWHQKAIARLFERADPQAWPETPAFKKKSDPKANHSVRFLPGNHEVGVNKTLKTDDGSEKHHRWINDSSLHGIKIEEEGTYTDSQNRKIRLVHGHVQDPSLYINDPQGKFLGIIPKKAAYVFFDSIYMFLYDLDRAVRKLPYLEDFSLAARAKKIFRKAIEPFLSVRKEIIEKLDNSSDDVLIFGHTHCAEIFRTPKGKLVINGGCSTEHVQGVVQDENGIFAVLTYHKWGFDVLEEPESPDSPPRAYQVRFKDLGLPDLPSKDSSDFPDAVFMDRANDLLRIVYTTTPARDVQAVRARTRDLARNDGTTCDDLASRHVFLQESFARTGLKKRLPLSERQIPRNPLEKSPAPR